MPMSLVNIICAGLIDMFQLILIGGHALKELILFTSNEKTRDVFGSKNDDFTSNQSCKMILSRCEGGGL